VSGGTRGADVQLLNGRARYHVGVYMNGREITIFSIYYFGEAHDAEAS